MLAQEMLKLSEGVRDTDSAFMSWLQCLFSSRKGL